MTKTKETVRVIGMDLIDVWARETTSRCQPGGDLHRSPLSLEKMQRPPTWSEQQLPVYWRYGELLGGGVAWVRHAR